MTGTACFLTGFWSKKGQNVRFQADFQGKPLIIERQFFRNVTVFYDRYLHLVFYMFLSKKRTKGEISYIFQRKPFIIE